MKIAVIGVARSRTTVLVEKLKILNPNLTCLYEYYTYNITKSSFCDCTNFLIQNNNFIVKILGQNLFPDHSIDALRLETYDRISLIERPDFFNQACSLEFSRKTNYWHSRNFSNTHKILQKRKFTLTKDTVHYLANSVSKYLEIKKFLKQKNIKYVQENYNDFDIVPKNIIEELNLNYSFMFTNYYLQNDVEKLFNLCFNYETCENNFPLFYERLGSIF